MESGLDHQYQEFGRATEKGGRVPQESLILICPISELWMNFGLYVSARGRRRVHVCLRFIYYHSVDAMDELFLSRNKNRHVIPGIRPTLVIMMDRGLGMQFSVRIVRLDLKIRWSKQASLLLNTCRLTSCWRFYCSECCAVIFLGICLVSSVSSIGYIGGQKYRLLRVDSLLLSVFFSSLALPSNINILLNNCDGLGQNTPCLTSCDSFFFLFRFALSPITHGETFQVVLFDLPPRMAHS